MSYLSDHFEIKRRYSRSINLERDLEYPEAVLGYVPTEKTADILGRFVSAALTPNSPRAWTLTGVYGTGKSAFAHFLTSICAPANEPTCKNAKEILNRAAEFKEEHKAQIAKLPSRGFVRAVATAQREPISNSILRGLNRGANLFWQRMSGVKPKLLAELETLAGKVARGNFRVPDSTIIELVTDVARASNTGVLLIIDELGKTLEYATENYENDLFLLQQLAELPSGDNDPKIFLFGLLHQSFIDYANSLTTIQRHEWGKIQGRFEDVTFTESPYQMIKIIGAAIDKNTNKSFNKMMLKYSENWHQFLSQYDGFRSVTADDVLSVFPLHPISSLTIPVLCQKYAQNDRSLFTFLSSAESSSFGEFLIRTEYDHNYPLNYKVFQLYDYFLDTAGMAISSRPNLQRWIEIQNRIREIQLDDEDSIRLLKTIGVFNLISSSGGFRASKMFVALAMCDDASDKVTFQKWIQRIDALIEKKVVLWRKSLDELRLWEGSDFDIEQKLMELLEANRLPLGELLRKHMPLKPVIAQRHSYKTGTLRYFERYFSDTETDWNTLNTSKQESDGLLFYWVDEYTPRPPKLDHTSDRKPVVFVSTNDLVNLKHICLELDSLLKIEATAPELQTDGVARKEMRQRVLWSRQKLEEVVSKAFDESYEKASYWVAGERRSLTHKTSLNSLLSDLCDKYYPKSLVLWNELINRRDLSSQAATARKKLIELMIKYNGKERFGITGYGPERSMFESLFAESNIYRECEGSWIIADPVEESGIYHVWQAIEQFCFSATETPERISTLYDILLAPPFGLKKGVIPVLLLAVLLKHSDHLALYDNGSFLPVIGTEHFEILVKNPAKFSVKHYQISGLCAEIFKEFEDLFRKTRTRSSITVRNTSILSIVTPLVKFIQSLPSYTLATKELSREAIAVRKAISETNEPDTLIFKSIPEALGFIHIRAASDIAKDTIKSIKVNFIKVLRELNNAYFNLLESSKKKIYLAFSINSDIANLRQDLRVRATYVQNVVEPLMKRFLIAATSDTANEVHWLESILMVISDKPAESWTDDDVIKFEISISDLARRFKNIEALQATRRITTHDGFEAKRICVTSADGNEVHQVVWTDKGNEEQIERLANQILINSLSHIGTQMQQAVICTLLDKLFNKNDQQDLDENEKPLKEFFYVSKKD
jgi:hypothetical protein